MKFDILDEANVGKLSIDVNQRKLSIMSSSEKINDLKNKDPSSSSEEDPNNPWGKNSPSRRIKKMEREVGVIQSTTEKDDQCHDNDKDIENIVKEIMETDSEVEQISLDESNPEKIFLPLLTDLSKSYEIEMKPNEENNNNGSSSNVPMNESLKVLISTSVQCNINPAEKETSPNVDIEGWKFVPNEALQEPVLLGYFARQNSTDMIKVFVDTDKMPKISTESKEELGWCSCYILTRLFFICLLLAGLTLLMLTSLP